MKHLLLLMTMVLSLTVGLKAQTLTKTSPFGSKGAYALHMDNDTVTVQPKYSATLYSCIADTNVWLNVDVSKSTPLSQLYFEVATDSTKRYIHFDTGFSNIPITDSIAANKHKLYFFLYNGSKYIRTNSGGEY